MPHVADTTEATFAADVIARSAEVPVVVDFWAAWCAPCRALGPTLEREVEALGGRVELKKVDVDTNQALSQRFGVQGIPAVMAFRHGQKVADFTGARDAAFVRRFLASLAPSAEAQALARATTEAELTALLGSAEVGPAARLALAELKLTQGRAADALALADQVPLSAGPVAEAAQRVRARAGLLADATRFGDLAATRALVAADPKNLDAGYALGCALAMAGDTTGALEAWLEVVRRNKAHADGAARKAMLTVFEQLGHQHETTREYRRRLQVVL